MSDIFSEAFRTELQDIVTTSVKSAIAQTGNPQTASLDRLLDTNAVSEYLGLTKPTIEKLVQEGKLSPIEIGERSKRFRLSEINTYLETTRRVV